MRAESVRLWDYDVVEAPDARVACEIVAKRSDIALLLTDVVSGTARGGTRKGAPQAKNV